MAVGTLIAEARQRHPGLSQQRLAELANVSRGLLSKHESGDRPVRFEYWKHYVEGLNDALFTLEIQREATGGVYIPYCNGEEVEHHPASLAFFIREQILEAEKHMAEINFGKPFERMTKAEIEHIDLTIDELLDVQAAAQTMIIDLCARIEDISYNSQVKQWIGRRTITKMFARRNL